MSYKLYPNLYVVAVFPNILDPTFTLRFAPTPSIRGSILGHDCPGVYVNISKQNKQDSQHICVVIAVWGIIYLRQATRHDGVGKMDIHSLRI